MLELIKNDPISCAICLIVFISFVMYCIIYRKDILRKAALYAVAEAEKEWGSKAGKIKFTQAYLYLKKKYPIITFFLTEETITETIENALVILQKILEVRNIKVFQQNIEECVEETKEQDKN